MTVFCFIFVLLFSFSAFSPPSSQQNIVRVGVMPFEGAGGSVSNFDQQLAGQLSRNNNISSRLVKPPTSGFVDRERIIQLGKKLDLEYVIQGRILNVRRNSGNRSTALPGLGNVRSSTQSGEVSVEADLISVSTGNIVTTLKAVGNASLRSTQTTISSRHGSNTIGSSQSGQDPVEQAASDAAEKLAKDILVALRP